MIRSPRGAQDLSVPDLSAEDPEIAGHLDMLGRWERALIIRTEIN